MAYRPVGRDEMLADNIRRAQEIATKRQQLQIPTSAPQNMLPTTPTPPPPTAQAIVRPAPAPVTSPPVAQRPAPAATQPAVPTKSPAAAPPPNPTRLIVTGDSVATGIGHGGARGNASSEAAWGRSSAEQLRYMQKKGAKYYQGADVILSSGILNSGDIRSVEAQLKFLRSSGVRSVRLAGAPLSGKFSVHNLALQVLAARYGFTFIGGYASDDGVHPRTYRNYR